MPCESQRPTEKPPRANRGRTADGMVARAQCTRKAQQRRRKKAAISGAPGVRWVETRSKPGPGTGRDAAPRRAVACAAMIPGSRRASQSCRMGPGPLTDSARDDSDPPEDRPKDEPHGERRVRCPGRNRGRVPGHPESGSLPVGLPRGAAERHRFRRVTGRRAPSDSQPGGS